MGKPYTNGNLIKYGETIQLHYDKTGKTAWLTLKNYGCVFGSQAVDEVQEVTIGVPAPAEGSFLRLDADSRTFLERMGLRLGAFKRSPFVVRIGEMLDASDVIKFQVAIAAAYFDKQRPSKGFAQKELYELIAAILSDHLGVEGPCLSFIKHDDAENCAQRASLRLGWILARHPGAKEVWTAIDQARSGKTGLTAYFPEPRLMLQEQSTAPFEQGLLFWPGRTKNQDMRSIEPLPSPSNAPIDPSLTGRWREKPGENEGMPGTPPFQYDDFLESVEKDHLAVVEGKDYTGFWTELSASKSPKAAGYLFEHIQRINCFAFRGDSRGPLQIQAAGGLLPGFTRKHVADKEDIESEIDAALKPGAKESYFDAIRKHNLLHLGMYLLDEKFKGYISTTTSTAIAKCFANLYQDEPEHRYDSVYCYAVRCRGGFYLPTPVEQMEKWRKEDHAQHRFVHFAEQEVAVVGAIPWDNDVVGVRIIACNKNGQLFRGPVFLKDQLRRDDIGAFSELFELFSGRSQGHGFEIHDSHRERPLEFRPSANPFPSRSAPKAAVAAVAPSSLTFSYQAVGATSAAQTVIVTNVGSLPLRFHKDAVITGANRDNFHLAKTIAARSNLKPGESGRVSVTFTPVGLGNVKANLVISHQGGTGVPFTVTLEGIGVLPLAFSASSLTFGSQGMAESSSQRVTVTNRGVTRISNVDVRPTGSWLDFNWTCDFRYLDPGESGTVTVTFQPREPGDRNATLDIHYDEFGSPQTVKLSGSGI